MNWHHKPEVIQAQHDWNRHFYPPVPIKVPNFHGRNIYPDVPFYDFEPVDHQFKAVIGSLATDTHPNVNPDTSGYEQAQALVTLWQASDTLDDFVDHLSDLDTPYQELVNLAHAFETSIERGLDYWDGLEPDLSEWGL